MSTSFYIGMGIAAVAAATAMVKWSSSRDRSGFIAGYLFPEKVRRRLKETYPHLSEQDVGHVLDGLRDYFQICSVAGRRMVSMPSQAVDVAWHEFILFTQAYERFCKRGVGRFVHHTPAEAMGSPTSAQKGIRHAWRLACRREAINPAKPDRLPRLFAIDASLGIPDGFNYTLNCTGPRTVGAAGASYCASHIGCSNTHGGGCGSCASGCGNDFGGPGGCSGSCGGGGD